MDGETVSTKEDALRRELVKCQEKLGQAKKSAAEARKDRDDVQRRLNAAIEERNAVVRARQQTRGGRELLRMVAMRRVGRRQRERLAEQADQIDRLKRENDYLRNVTRRYEIQGAR